MDRIKNYVPNDQVLSAELNALQDRIDNVRRGSADTELVDWQRTGQSIIRQISATTVGANSAIELDATIDWRNYLVEGWIATLNSANDAINGSAPAFVNQYLRDSKRFVGFLGTGSTTTFNRAGGEFYIEADFEPVGPSYTWIVYAATADGKLYVYNDTGSARRAIVCVRAIGRET